MTLYELAPPTNIVPPPGFAGSTGAPALGASFAVHGNHTDDGVPILAGAAHTGFASPSPWYLLELSAAASAATSAAGPGAPLGAAGALHDALHVSGATLPGAGAVVFSGLNGFGLSWAFAAGGGDVQDVYVERLREDGKYLVNEKKKKNATKQAPAAAAAGEEATRGEWRTLDVLTEEIRVRGRAKPEVWLVRSTRHGPLISDLDPQTTVPERTGAIAGAGISLGLALRWAGSGRNVNGSRVDRSASVIESLARATGVADFLATVDDNAAQYRGAHLAVTLASTANTNASETGGTIAYVEIGALPLRSSRHSGAVPAPGWKGESLEWRGFAPASEMPRTVNPSRGFVVAGAPAVQRRAAALLQEDLTAGAVDESERFTTQRAGQLQRDSYSPRAARLCPSLVLTLRGEFIVCTLTFCANPAHQW